MNLAGKWIDRVYQRKSLKQIILDMDSSVSPTYGNQEGTAYNGYFQCTCYHPLFCFNQYGDLERALLRNGNVHSADDWRNLLEPIVKHSRYVVLQMAEVVVPRSLFREILERIGRLRASPELVRTG